MVKKRAPAPVLQIMDCSHPERLQPLIVISMVRKRAPVPPSIPAILVPPCIEISMARLPARAQLGAGCHAKVPIIITDGAVQNQKVNSLEKFSPTGKK